MDAEEVIRLAGAKARGRRPQFFANPEIDRLVSITLALAGELAVTRERLDTLERLLAQRAVLNREDIEGYVPDRQAAQERGRWHQEYLARVLRVLQQEVEALQQSDPQAEQVAGELSKPSDAD